MKREYGLDVFLGPLQVAFREMLASAYTHTAVVDDVLDDKRRHSCTIVLQLRPSRSSLPFALVMRVIAVGRFDGVQIDLIEGTSLLSPRPDWIKAINEGCVNALHNGPLLGFPVQVVHASIQSAHGLI